MRFDHAPLTYTPESIAFLGSCRWFCSDKNCRTCPRPYVQVYPLSFTAGGVSYKGGESSTTTGEGTKVLAGQNVVPGVVYRGRGRGGGVCTVSSRAYANFFYVVFHPHPAGGMKVEQGCRFFREANHELPQASIFCLGPPQGTVVKLEAPAVHYCEFEPRSTYSRVCSVSNV